MSRAVQENMDYLKNLETKLRSARALSPRVEAETLVTYFTRMKRLDLFTGNKKISPSARLSIDKALRFRRKGIPLAHVTGQAPFYGRFFQVTKDTLIPRPETEVLVEAVLTFLKNGSFRRAKRGEISYKNGDFSASPRNDSSQIPEILDLGTGSGCIAVSLTLEYPACRMTALDASPKALAVSAKNVESFGVGRQVSLVESCLFESFGPEKYGFWDVLVSNPPYIPEEDWKSLPREVMSEPRLALDGGKDGLEVIQKILLQAPLFLKPGGHIFMEIGKDQSVALTKFLKNRKEYKGLHFIKDLNWIDRVLVAQKNG